LPCAGGRPAGRGPAGDPVGSRLAEALDTAEGVEEGDFGRGGVRVPFAPVELVVLGAAAEGLSRNARVQVSGVPDATSVARWVHGDSVGRPPLAEAGGLGVRSVERELERVAVEMRPGAPASAEVGVVLYRPVPRIVLRWQVSGRGRAAAEVREAVCVFVGRQEVALVGGQQPGAPWRRCLVE
jgi:hypothetical protein